MTTLYVFAWIDTPVSRVIKAYQYDENGNVIKELDGSGYAVGTGANAAAHIQSGYRIKTIYNANLPVSVLDPVGANTAPGGRRKICTTTQVG